MTAFTEDGDSTQAATALHVGLQTFAAMNLGAKARAPGSSLVVPSARGNASGCYVLTECGGGTGWYTEAFASGAVLVGAVASGGVPMTLDALMAGLCVSIGQWRAVTMSSAFVAEHVVNDSATASTLLVNGPLPTGLTFALFNEGSAGATIVIPNPSEASVSAALNVQPTLAGRAIADKFDEALAEVRDDLSDDESAAAERAIADARQTVASLHFASTPLIWVNDEGVAAVQWEAWPTGVLLVFTGDGTFTASVRDGDRKRYITGAREYAVSGGIPPDLSEAILALC